MPTMSRPLCLPKSRMRFVPRLLFRLGEVRLAFVGDVQPVFNSMVELLAR